MIIYILGVALIIVLFLMPIYVYFDAKRRGKEHPFLWFIASWFIPLVWIYWLCIRNKYPVVIK